MYRISLVLGAIIAPVALHATLTPFADRSLWESAVALPGVLTNVGGSSGRNWVDFVSPTCLSTTGVGGCPISSVSHGGNVLQVSGVPGLTFQGFAGTLGTRLAVYAAEPAASAAGSTNWRINNVSVPWIMSRNRGEAADVRLRATLPVGADAFAMEVALGCYSAASGCSVGDNYPGVITVTVGTGSTTLATTTIQTVDTSPTVGEFTFYGATVDAGGAQIWIDLTPDSPGAVAMARFTYATELSSPGGGGAVPEPPPGWLFATGLGLLVTRHLIQRKLVE